MKNVIKKSYLVATILLATIVSCNNDDSAPITPFNLQNLEVTIDENPTNGQVIGSVQSNSSNALTYSIATQTPAGALSINASTGELTVLDETLFDFEANPTITATVSATGASNLATVTVNLLDKHEVGEYKFGGVIFWVNAAGSEGLVCAVEDQSSGIIWNNPSGMTSPIAGTSSDFGTGSTNTDLIISNEGAVQTSYAAGLARAYNGGGFNNWFLPSSGECLEMYNNKATINTTAVANGGTDFSSIGYWSSTRQPSTTQSVFLFSFTTGSVNGVLPTNARNVRAIRRWTDF